MATENTENQGTGQAPENPQAAAGAQVPRWMERLKKRFPDKDFADEVAAKDEFYAVTKCR